MKDETITMWANLFKRAGEFLLYALAVGLLLGLLITVFIGKPSEIKDTFNTKKIIDKRIDSLKQDNVFIISRMYEQERNQTKFYDAISKSNELMKEYNTNLIKLKKIYNEKITNVNTYNVSQLDSFFANRYKDYYNNR